MRGVSRWGSRGTPLLAVFLVLTAGSAWPDELPPTPTDSPQARVNPPGGVTTQARVEPPVGIAPPPPDATPQVRLQPPGGVTTQARLEPPVGVTARMNPPVGAPDQLSLFDMILIWLQSRLSIPHG